MFPTTKTYVRPNLLMLENCRFILRLPLNWLTDWLATYIGCSDDGARVWRRQHVLSSAWAESFSHRLLLRLCPKGHWAYTGMEWCWCWCWYWCWCCIVLYSIVLYCIVLYCIVLYWIIDHTFIRRPTHTSTLRASTRLSATYPRACWARTWPSAQ